MGTTPSGTWPEQLRAAVDGADLRILLMCLVHLTGDLRWLEEPYRPRRDVRLVAPPDAGLSDEVADAIRTAAIDLLAPGVPDPLIDDPGPELMERMMSVCLGETVPPEYIGMMREDMGLVSRDDGLTTTDVSSTPEVLIIGAGVSGLALGAQLGRLGIRYTIVEKNDEVGGTWWENRYPGCGVDTPNHAYSFSFGERNRWTRYFCERDQIQGYLERCADAFDVRRHTRFGVEVTGAEWLEERRRWRVALRRSDGDVKHLDADVLVSALGLLNVPRMPDIAGLDEFRGRLVHTARWPADLDARGLAGKRVAVIGTGASAMQTVPSIAPLVDHLTVFQRSPQWVRPIEGYRDDIPDAQQWLLDQVPYYVEWFRFVMMWRYGDGLLTLLRRDPAWPHPERAMNRINDRHRQEMADFIHHELGDRHDLIAQCVPDYPPYGKRILIDNGWYRTLRRPNVELVTTPIECITPTGIRTIDRTDHDRTDHDRTDHDRTDHDVDLIVLATGFHTTRPLARLDIRGRDGRTLDSIWADDDATAHLGITIPGFPNLFMMGGPNTGLGHGGSGIFQSECQARYISAMLVEMTRRGLTAVEVRPEVHDEFVAKVDAEHAELIWTHPGMTNWYRNRHGRIVAIMPFRLVDYWQMTHDPDLDEYQLTPSAHTP